MAKLMCIGRVTADLELRESARKNPTSDFPWRRIWDTVKRPAHSISKCGPGDILRGIWSNAK